MNFATFAVCFVIGGLLGLAAGILIAWLLMVRPREDERAKAHAELEKLRVQHEADAEKLVWLEKAETQLREAFEALASQSLRTNADEFLNRSKAELSQFVTPLSEDLSKLDTRIHELEEKRAGAYEGLKERLQQLG
ncbi:MAG: hypothetical protein ACP5HG_13965 [Anaerolineae bacterium]